MFCLRFTGSVSRGLSQIVHRLQTLGHDAGAQDLVEYALLGGFVAVSGAAVFPSISEQLWIIYAKVFCVLVEAAGVGLGCASLTTLAA